MTVRNAGGGPPARVVAIDAGTTGVRSLVVDQAGRVVDAAYQELPQHFPRPGWVEHDPVDIWGAVQFTLAEVASRLSDSGGTVAAIGITNQRETALAWDRRTGVPLHRAIVWQDRRTAGRCDQLREAGWLPVVRERTGLVLDPYFSATKYEWLLHNAGELGAGRRPQAGPRLALGTVDTWILWNLTGGVNGGVFATDATNASRTLLLDTATLAWTPELCDLFHVPLSALAGVGPSCGRFGTADAGAVGGRSSLLAGVPVSGIAGDQQAALFGQACFTAGMAKVTYGTGSFVLVNAGPVRPAPPDGLVATVAWDLGDHAGAPPHVGPTADPARQDAGRCGRRGGSVERGGSVGRGGSVTYALEGSTFVSGAAVQWLRDGLGIIDRAEDLGPLAASVPDSGGTVVVPAFTGLGSPWWDPRARGTITGITRGTGRAQLARATLEAMAFQVRDMTDAMAGTVPGTVPGTADAGCHQLRADGGASRLDLLLQLQADQSGVPVLRMRSVESTALGAATLAGLAEGVWGSTEELAGLWEADVELTPVRDRSQADAAYAGWVRALARSREWALDAPP
ncbi:MAG: FGGY family carbohydrate kinase [Acidimicrobiales bacterium]